MEGSGALVWPILGGLLWVAVTAGAVWACDWYAALS